MPIDTDIKTTIARLVELAGGRFSRERLARMQDVHEQLGDLFIQADAMLRGRLDLRGDLSPELETDDETEENDDMAQSERERLLLFMRVIDDADVRREAKQDALGRIEARFANEDVDGIAVRDFLDREVRRAAPHLWVQASSPVSRPGPGSGPPGAGPQKPRRPQPLQLTPAQEEELYKLPVAQRLTAYRELQEQAQRS
jgi:hypothetical protein